MIQAIRLTEGLPGGALCALVTDGEDTLLIADSRAWGCGPEFYDLLNSLLDELDPSGGGDYAVDGPVIEERRTPQVRSPLGLVS